MNVVFPEVRKQLVRVAPVRRTLLTLTLCFSDAQEEEPRPEPRPS